MSGTPSDKKLAAEIGQRLALLIRDFLDLSVAELSALLGYRTDATLRQAINGEATLRADKLCALAAIEVSPGAFVNLDWVMCGRGAPLIQLSVHASASPEEVLDRFKVLSAESRRHLLSLALLLH